MKTRGIRDGILITLDGHDTLEVVERGLVAATVALRGRVSIEVAGKIDPGLVETVRSAVSSEGGTLADLRPTAGVAQTRGQTVIVGRTVRSGGRVESTGSIVVLGDVNAGAEVIAADDVIVVGRLRGLAHAGAAGNDKAIVWARKIEASQLRIAHAVAQAGAPSEPRRGAVASRPDDDDAPEVALVDTSGRIAIRAWTSTL